MSNWNQGDRVFAISHQEGNEVYVFGDGTYAGKQPVPAGRALFGETVPGLTNHRIDLDNGESVFGHECWWGSRESMGRFLDGKNVVMVTVADMLSRRQEEYEG